MYTEKDTTEAKRALSLFIAGLVLYTAVFAVLIVVALKGRIAWLNALCLVVYAVGAVFLWGNFGAKLWVWRRFLRDMNTGLERQVNGEIAAIDDQPSHKDGLECRALRLLTGEESDKAGGRVLYIDASRFPLPISVGQKVCCTVFGNYIKRLATEEDA